MTGIGLGLAAGVLGSLYIGDLARFIEARFGVVLLNADVYPMDYLPSQLQVGDIVTVQRRGTAAVPARRRSTPARPRCRSATRRSPCGLNKAETAPESPIAS